MNALEFLEEHVRPTIDCWRRAPGERWRALNAAVNLNQLADYRWHDLGCPGTTADLRRDIVERCGEFQLIWDVADVHKHMQIGRSGRSLTAATQAVIVELGFGQAEFGVDEWGSPPIVVIYLDDGRKERLGPCIETALAWWTEEVGT